MAQLNTHGPCVDLTPMVDLGFLLITFFIYTTTLSQPSVVALAIPAEGPHTPIAQSGAITLVPLPQGVACFVGNMPNAKPAIYPYSGPGGIRQQLLAIQLRLNQPQAKSIVSMVLIKPSAQANLKQVVQLLDEMVICGFKRYTLLPLDPQLAQLF